MATTQLNATHRTKKLVMTIDDIIKNYFLLICLTYYKCKYVNVTKQSSLTNKNEQCLSC